MTDPFVPPPSGSVPPPQTSYGAPAQHQPPPSGGYPQQAPPQYGAPLYGAPLPNQARNGLGTTSLILGILSCVFLWAFFVPAGLAVVFGFVGRARAKRGQASNGGAALAGAITGIVGIVFGIVFWVFVSIFISSDSYHRYTDCMNAANDNRVLQDACTKNLQHDLFGTTSH